jgi:hypothetical protein
MFIIIKSSAGFGNKIFDLLIGLYLQYINGRELYWYPVASHHDKPSDPAIFDIFPKLKKHYKLISNKEELESFYKYKNYQLFCSDIKKMGDFKLNIDAEVIYISKKLFKCYQFVYEIYQNLPEEIKNIFTINETIISDKIREIGNKEKYVTVHIRYGDKLNISVNDQTQFQFLVYTPKFYRKMIKKFLKKKCKIYIVTDDENIVKKYIVDKINNDDVKILSIPWWESFYILTKSRYNILSLSTFSFLASLINKKLKKAYVVTRPNDIKFTGIPEEKIIENTEWVKLNKKEYILNYRQKLIKNMVNSR